MLTELAALWTSEGEALNINLSPSLASISENEALEGSHNR
jgi:hypothetical protein